MSDLNPGIGKHIIPIKEIIQSCDIWFEKALYPDGEIHVADILGQGNGAFSLISGNNDFGEWVLILGSSDTLIDVEKRYFSITQIYAPEIEKEKVYYINFVSGEDPDNPEKNTTIPLKPISKTNAGSIKIYSPICSCSTKIWARCKCAEENGAEIQFFFGIIETKNI